MNIQDITIFTRVAALNNLSAVGVELRLSPGTISKRLQLLENELGVRLFDRTTRSLRITEEGKTFLSSAERVLREVDGVRSVLSDSVTRPRGLLRVVASGGLGRLAIAPAVSAFVKEHPDVEVHIDLANRSVNLQEDGYDVAIRTGTLSDSSLIARRLGVDPSVVVAAPEYLQRYGTPQNPLDLTTRNCLILSDQRNWTFRRDGNEVPVRVAGRLTTNSVRILLQAVLDGQGLACLPLSCVAMELAAGRLRAVLDDYEVMGDGVIWAIYPSARHVPPRLRAFLDFLAPRLRETMENEMPRRHVDAECAA